MVDTGESGCAGRARNPRDRDDRRALRLARSRRDRAAARAAATRRVGTAALRAPLRAFHTAGRRRARTRRSRAGCAAASRCAAWASTRCAISSLLGYWSQDETWPLVGYAGPLLRRPRGGVVIEKLLGPQRRSRHPRRRVRDRLGRRRRGRCSGAGRRRTRRGRARAGPSLDVQRTSPSAKTRCCRASSKRPACARRKTARSSCLQGRCVGGSTVHNLCYAFRTPDPILRMWRDEHGLARAHDRGDGAVLRARRAQPEGEADPRGRGQRAEPRDPRGHREARLVGLRHEAQPRGLRPVGLLHPRLLVRRQAVDARHLRAARRAGRGAHLLERARRSHRRRRAAACAASSGASSTTPGSPGRAHRRAGEGRGAGGGRGGVAGPAAAQSHRESQRAGRPQPAPASRR